MVQDMFNFLQETETPDTVSAPPKDELAILILSTNGPFTTTRAVMRTCSTRRKPTSQEVAARMRALEAEGLGFYKDVDKTKAFFKAMPREEIKGALEKYMKLEQYRHAFLAKDIAYVTPAQHQRLLDAAPESENLKAYYSVGE